MPEQDLRRWLRENGHDETADLIDGFIARWKADGKRTRRNWWEILAGGRLGRPRTIEGKEFPVLKAAQTRQGLPVTANALFLTGEKPPPPIPRESGRWPKRQRKRNTQSSKSKNNISTLSRGSRVVGDFPRSA
jgi:hypothetical protein